MGKRSLPVLRGTSERPAKCEKGLSRQDETIGPIAILNEVAVRVWTFCAVIRAEGPTDDVGGSSLPVAEATGYGR